MNLGAAQEIVRGRSGGLCEVCRRQGIQTHHRQNRQSGGSHRLGAAMVNKPSALVRLCLECHDWVGHNPDHAKVLGLLVPRPADPGEPPVFLRIIFGEGWWLLDDEGCYSWFHGEPPPVDFSLPGVR